MQNVYLEWFLFDNALMAYLILRSAAAMARMPTRTFPLYAISGLSAVISAAAMLHPAFLSIPAKAVLLFAMTLPLGWKSKSQWARSAVCVLAATFFFGGMAYALAFFFESDFRGGVLYASSSVRAVLVAMVLALCVPPYIRRTLRTTRLSRTRMVLGIETKFGATRLRARLDTGLTLFVDDAPVVVVDARAAARALPPGWPEGHWFECGVPGMGVLSFRNTEGRGMMPTLPATVSWRWEEPPDQPKPTQKKPDPKALVRPAGAFWEDNRTPNEKRKAQREKRAKQRAETWLGRRGCRIAIASEPLEDCGALVGMDFVELH